MSADQPEEFEEVYVGVEQVLDDLQPLWRQDAHGVPDGVEPSAAGEYQESLQEVKAAGDVLQMQVWDAEGELKTEDKGWFETGT